MENAASSTIPCKACGYLLDPSNLLHVRCPKCGNVDSDFMVRQLERRMQKSSNVIDIYDQIRDKDCIEAIVVDTDGTAETMLITLRGAAKEDPHLLDTVYTVGAFEGKGKIEIIGRNINGEMDPLRSPKGPMILIIPRRALPLVKEHYSGWPKVSRVHEG